MFFFFFVPPTRKRTKKKKARRKKLSWPRLRQGFSGPALRFSLMTGLSELGLLPIPQTCRQAFTVINCDAH